MGCTVGSDGLCLVPNRINTNEWSEQDVMFIDKDGNNYAHACAYKPESELLRVIALLGHQFNVHRFLSRANSVGDTPLLLAVKAQNVGVITEMLKYELDVQMTNIKDENALNLAEKTTCSETIRTMIMSCHARNQVFLQKSDRGFPEMARHFSLPPYVINMDISGGLERFPVRCLSANRGISPPDDFTYITENVFSSGFPANLPHNFDPCRNCADSDCRSRICSCCKTTTTRTIPYGNDDCLAIEHFVDPMCRPYIFECSELCTCNPIKCVNRVVQRGSDIPMQIHYNKLKGWSVTAQIAISKGAFVVEYTGEYFDKLPDGSDDSYAFNIGEFGMTLDAARCGNVARFINHSCNPNLTVMQVFTEHQDFKYPHICMFALRDILVCEELTFDYGVHFWSVKNKHIACKCGEGCCRYKTRSMKS